MVILLYILMMHSLNFEIFLQHSGQNYGNVQLILNQEQFLVECSAGEAMRAMEIVKSVKVGLNQSQ